MQQAVCFMEPIDPISLITPKRKINGISAILHPIRWIGFGRMVLSYPDPLADVVAGKVITPKKSVRRSANARQHREMAL